MAESIITATRRWPVTTGAPVVFVPEDVLTIENREAPAASTGQGPMSQQRAFQYQGWAGPIVVPEQSDPFDPSNSLAKWLGSYPSRLYSKPGFHASQYPPTPTRDVSIIFDPATVPLGQQSIPIFTRSRRHLYESFAKTILRVELSVHMWGPRYPDYHFRKPNLNYIPQGSIGPDRLPDQPDFKIAWIGEYPDYIWRAKPLYHLAPTWFGPDIPRLNQPTEVEDFFVWFLQRPEQTYGNRRFPHLVPFFEWHTETGPDVIAQKRRGNLLTMKVGF